MPLGFRVNNEIAVIFNKSTWQLDFSCGPKCLQTLIAKNPDIPETTAKWSAEVLTIKTCKIIKYRDCGYSIKKKKVKLKCSIHTTSVISIQSLSFKYILSCYTISFLPDQIVKDHLNSSAKFMFRSAAEHKEL